MVNAKFFAMAGIVTLAVLASSCGKPREKPPDVILLHSGRMRGNVYPLSLQNIAPLQHYQYLAGYIRDVREEAAKSGTRVFLVDLGDSLDGSFASHVTGGQNMVSFFNGAGYDAVQLSNLDGQVRDEAVRGLKAKVLNPFESAAGATTVPGTAAGARFDLGDLPLFFLANFYGDADPALHPERFPGKFGPTADRVRPVRNYAPIVEALGARPPGSLTLMGWMKFEPSDNPPEPLLRQMSSLKIDAVLAHRIYGSKEREAWEPNAFVNWQPPVSLNILRNNGGFALARMDMARVPGGWKILRHQLLPMTANNAAPDAGVVAEIENFAARIKAADTRVTTLDRALNPPQILDAYMAALATVPGTQAVAYSPESIRADWSAGELRASGVFNSLPWTTGLVQMKLTPAQLTKLMDAGILRVAVAPGLPDGDIRLTTSYFFSRLISERCGVEENNIATLPQSSEFDFFVEYLGKNPGAGPGGIDPSWTIHEPK